ncbi:MAG: hypothetical protein LQ351_007724 [Letrouitia transgressa]|nr:MAG: hypothetical protein LQ351_007724 [Letrouitia transgressa]
MKFLAISAALLLAVSSASAAPVVEDRQFAAQITFYGAADAKYSLSIPADGRIVPIMDLIFQPANPLSVSKISSLGGATCSFKGVDGSNTIVVGAQIVDVGPPQTQISANCRTL